MPSTNLYVPVVRHALRRIGRIRVAIAIFGIGCGALPGCQPKAEVATNESTAATPATPAVTPATSANPSVTEFGYGPLRAGMTYTAANDSLKGALKAAKDANLAECDYVTWEGGPAGLRVMVVEGKIARVDVVDSSSITTGEGARIGDTEERVKSLYGDRVTVTNHKYEDGHYLTVRSATANDTLHRIIFETSNGKVTRYRAGAMPGVEYVEGCS